MPEITLSELLEAKEDRVRRRLILHQECPGTCLSLSLEYPGRPKRLSTHQDLVPVRSGLHCSKPLCADIANGIRKDGAACSHRCRGRCGDCQGNCLPSRNGKDFSRLLDIDVYDATGKAVASPDRKSGRGCFLCPELAVVCMREARHSPQEISLGIEHLFTSFQTAMGRDIFK